jgi:hypothetical protein
MFTITDMYVMGGIALVLGCAGTSIVFIGISARLKYQLYAADMELARYARKRDSRGRFVK